MAVHAHSVYDTDTHFIVDPITRQVKNERTKKVSIVRDDHNSEVYTFELPRYIEGHDMATCNLVEVHYQNTHHTTKETSTGTYRVADFGVSETDPEKVTFSWTISCNATKFAGSLAFSLHLACVDANTDEALYWWATTTNTHTTVLDCINNTEESDEDETTDLQPDKTVTPTRETQVVRPDGEYRGLARVLVEPIPPEYTIPTGTLFVDANGDYDVTGYASASVAVTNAEDTKLQSKTVTENMVTVTPDEGYYGLSEVVVEIEGLDDDATLQQKEIEITENDEYTIVADEEYAALSQVSIKVNVEPKLQSKSVYITEDKPIVVLADEGYDGLVSVMVAPTFHEIGHSAMVYSNSSANYEILLGGIYNGTE